MTTTCTDTRPLFTTSLAMTMSAVAGVRPDQLDLPTPCGSFDVRALLGHLVMVAHRVEVVGLGADPMSVHEDVATGIADDAWVREFAVAAERAVRAWQNGAMLGETIVFPWITHSGSDTLVMYAGELATHTWDLAQATGQQIDWDPEILEAALTMLTEMLPDPLRATSFEAARDSMPPEYRDFPPPFADATPVPTDAPLIDRLVAWSGRRP